MRARRWVIAVVITITVAAAAMADLLLEQISPSWNRGQITSYYSTNTYLGGATIQVTNATAFSDSVGSAAQDLTGLGGYITVANTQTSAVYAVTSQIATSGTFSAVIILPTNGYNDCGMWLTLTNSTTKFTYKGDIRIYLRTPFK